MKFTPAIDAQLDDRLTDQVVRNMARQILELQDLSRRYAGGRVAGATGALRGGYNVATVQRVSTGIYRIRLTIPFDAQARQIELTAGGVGAIAQDMSAADASQEFTVLTFNMAGAALDLDFAFRVQP